MLWANTATEYGGCACTPETGAAALSATRWALNQEGLMASSRKVAANKKRPELLVALAEN